MRTLNTFRPNEKIIVPIQLVLFMSTIAIPFLFFREETSQYLITHNKWIVGGFALLILAYHFFGLHTFFHEKSHYNRATALGYEAEIDLKRKYCFVKGQMSRNDFIKIAIAPLWWILISFLALLAIGMFVESHLMMGVLYYGVIAITGMFWDFFMVAVASLHSKDTYYELNKEENSFSVLEKKGN